MAVAAAAGRIYALGGADGMLESNTVFIYDPATDRWTAGAPLPTPREHVVAATIGSRIYVVGGRTMAGVNTGVLEAWDVVTETWHTLDPMPSPRSGHGAAVLNGKLYVFGGENLLNGGVFDTVEEYDPATGAWRAVRALPAPRTGPGVVTVGDAIHVIGGSDQSHITRPTHFVFRMP
jgi:N-acetylneuraminic acid mutarotase